jgi:hypothetical protein
MAACHQQHSHTAGCHQLAACQALQRQQRQVLIKPGEGQLRGTPARLLGGWMPCLPQQQLSSPLAACKASQVLLPLLAWQAKPWQNT